MSGRCPEVVESVLRDARASGVERISLVDVIWGYDARNKLAVLPEEINEALSRIDWIVEDREDEQLFLCFTSNPVGSHVVVSDADFRWADAEYRRRFWRAYEELTHDDLSIRESTFSRVRAVLRRIVPGG